MATPRFDTPVYFLRSRGGEVLGPFSLAEVKAQLDARKISNDGDLRRQGWEVLEKEELWGKIKDFPVFGYAGPTGRHEVYALKSKAKTIWAVGIALLVITLGAFVGMFFIPFREAEIKMEESRVLAAKAKAEGLDFRKRLDAEVSAAKKQWTAEFDSNLKNWEADKARSLNELTQVKQKLSSTEASLGEARTKNDELAGELTAIKIAKAASEEKAGVVLAQSRKAEAASKKEAADLKASFDERVTQAEVRLRSELEGLIERYKQSSKNDLLRPLSNPRMARVLPQTHQGKGKLILLVATRRPAGTKLELNDGEKTLRVTVSAQVMGPPMMLVDIDPGQVGSVSAAGFLDSEVLLGPAN
jgi:hypothetical protein